MMDILVYMLRNNTKKNPVRLFFVRPLISYGASCLVPPLPPSFLS
jgi:hypothetical protein